MSFSNTLFGSKPSVPKFKPIDIEAEQQAAIKANEAALPESQKLATSVNTFNQSELERMLEQAIPGFDRMRTKVMDNIQSQLEGKVPTDVADYVQRSTAAKALAGGWGGTGMSKALTARDLGLTSYNLTQQGLDSATKWSALSRQMFMPGQFDVTSAFISPQQRVAFKTEERNTEFQVQWMRNQISAMMHPAAAAVREMFLSAMSAYGGGYSGQGNPYANGSGGGYYQGNSGDFAGAAHDA